MSEIQSLVSRLVSPDVEIYKTFVDTAERNIERRLQTNRYFFALTAALFVAYAFLLENRTKRLPDDLEVIHTIAFWTLPVLLLIISLSWYLAIRAFRSLSKAKYDVISRMEKELPQKPFLLEWEAQEVKILTGTVIEMIVPLVFGLIAVCGLVIPFYNIYGPTLRKYLGL